MDRQPPAPDSAAPFARATAPLSLEAMVTRSMRIFFRRFFALMLPAFTAFYLNAAGCVGLAALGGLFGPGHGRWYAWFEAIASSLLMFACSGAALGANAAVVRDECLGRPGGLGEAFRPMFHKIRPLFGGMFLYHVFVMVPALPGGWLLWLALGQSQQQKLAPAFGLILLAGLALYYPMKIFLRLILFGFTIVGENAGAVEAMRRSWRWLAPRVKRGWKNNRLFQVFILLHVSLVPAAIVFFAGIGAMVAALLIGGPADFEIEQLRGGALNGPFLLLQWVSATVMAIILPIFVVPLGVLYGDIRGQEAPSVEPEA